MSNALILTAKSSEEKETGGISNLSSSIAKGRDQGKPLENVSSKFFVGTEVSLGCILSGLEMLTLKKKSRYYFAQFGGPKYFHPPWKFYLVQLTPLSGNLILASCLLRSPSLTYGTRPKPNRLLSPLHHPCSPRECE